MEKNQEFIGVVDDLGCNGEGIIHNGDTVVFVNGALYGETVKYKILKIKKQIAYGKLLEVITPSDFRVKPKCDVFLKCGGCQLQHLKYSEQLKFKQKLVKDCLKKIALIDFEVDETVGSDLEYGYRNKLQLPVRHTKDGNKIGFFAENSHRIVPITSCALHGEWATKIIEILGSFIEKYHVTCYDDETGKGLLKHIVVKNVGGRLIIILVITDKTLPHIENLVERFDNNFKNYVFYLNVNKFDDNVILGRDFIHIKGDKKIIYEEDGIRHSVGAQAFMQVNDGVKHKLYNAVKEYAEIDENTVIVDAYSGGGIMTAILGKDAKRAIGIEIVSEAVESANELAKNSGLLDKVHSICGSCEELLPKVIEEIKRNNEKCVLVLDPPRKGVDVTLIDVIKRSKPDKIIYVSCSPQTLARDLGLLLGRLKYDGQIISKAESIESDYEIKRVTPFEMFAQTKHVETVVLITRVNK